MTKEEHYAHGMSILDDTRDVFYGARPGQAIGVWRTLGRAEAHFKLSGRRVPELFRKLEREAGSVLQDIMKVYAKARR